MSYYDALGIDASKQTLDAFLYQEGLHRKFENNTKGFKQLRTWFIKHSKDAAVLICFEHTGLYTLPLALFLENNQLDYVMESPLQIKKSLGITRGKNDKVDSFRIAEYAYQRRDQLFPTRLPSKNLLKISRLLTLRDRMVKQRGGYRAYMKECKTILSRKEDELLFKTQEQMIGHLTTKITQLEKTIKELIKEDELVDQQFKLVTTVKGVGFVLATNMLVMTQCFTRFNNSRKFACYSGVAPFKYQSGTSINSKSKVNPLANKKMKKLLNMAAMVSIQYDPEMRTYYDRRISQGKSPMSSLNVIRNKILHRVFAVIKRGTPYVVENNMVTA